MKQERGVRAMAAGLSVLMVCGSSVWAGGATKKTTAPQPPKGTVKPPVVKPPASAEDAMQSQDQMNRTAAQGATQKLAQTNKATVIKHKALSDALKNIR